MALFSLVGFKFLQVNFQNATRLIQAYSYKIKEVALLYLNMFSDILPLALNNTTRNTILKTKRLSLLFHSCQSSHLMTHIQNSKMGDKLILVHGLHTAQFNLKWARQVKP